MEIRTLETEFVPGPNTKKLLVVLHGRGDSLAGFRWLPDALGLPLNYLLVNAPDPYVIGRSWYDLPPDQTPGVVRSRRLLDELFQEVLSQGYEASDVALLGFSQGCLMTLEFGARTALDLAGFVGISGYCLDPDALLAELHPVARQEKWLITHGTQDAALAFDITDRQVQRLQEGGLPIDFRAYEKAHTIDPIQELGDIRDFLRRSFEV